MSEEVFSFSGRLSAEEFSRLKRLVSPERHGVRAWIWWGVTALLLAFPALVERVVPAWDQWVPFACGMYLFSLSLSSTPQTPPSDARYSITADHFQTDTEG